MIEIRVPKLNNNDATYVLLEWAAKDGQEVRPGDPLASVETSKAVEELEAEEGGILRHRLAEGDTCAPGQVIAWLLAPGEEPSSDDDSGTRLDGASGDETTAEEDIVITEPARRLMEERGISMERVRALGKKVIRRTDLENLASEELIESSRVQRRIAEVVTESHRTIPVAYALMRVDVTEALVRAREMTRRERALIGIPELVIDATAALLERFPVFFASPAGPEGARPATAVGVGVTIDVGRGMFVPVVKNADRLGPAGIARELTRFRSVAMNGAFTEADLSDGVITLTLHTDDAMIMAIPIIFPGQMCALALTAPRPEVVEDRGGGFTVRKVVSLGLAYDHRYINGRQAAEFLGAIRAAIESPAASER